MYTCNTITVTTQLLNDGCWGETKNDKGGRDIQNKSADFPFGLKQLLAPRCRGMSLPHSLPSLFPSRSSTRETKITIYSKRKKHRLTRCFYSISTLSPLTENFTNFSHYSPRLLSDFLERCN